MIRDDLNFDPSRSPEVEAEGTVGKPTGDFLYVAMATEAASRTVSEPEAREAVFEARLRGVENGGTNARSVAKTEHAEHREVEVERAASRERVPDDGRAAPRTDAPLPPELRYYYID